MISESLIDLGFGFLGGVFESFPKMEWSVNTGAFQFLSDALNMICYIIPLGTVKHIITMVITIAFMRIMIAIFRTIWELIPFV